MKYAGWIVAVLAGVVLLWWKPCNPTPPPDRVDQIDSVVRERERIANIKLDSLNTEIGKRDSAIDELMRVSLAQGHKLAATETRAGQLAAEVRAARGRRDTVELIASCDTLAFIVDSLIADGRYFRMITDSTFSLYDQQLTAKDSVISNRALLYSQLRTSFDTVVTDYRGLREAYNKEVKRGKRARTWNKILGAAVIVTGGLLIAK